MSRINKKPLPPRRVEPAPRSAPKPRATDDVVRVAAYHEWEAAGRPPGDGVEFWLRAERKLR